MIYQTRYLDSNSEIVWETSINALSAEAAVATTVFFEWAPGAKSVQIVDPEGFQIYVISKNETSQPCASIPEAFQYPSPGEMNVHFSQ